MRDLRGLPEFCLLMLTLCGLCVQRSSAQTPVHGNRGHPSRWLDSSQEVAVDRLFSQPPNSPGYAVALIKDGEFAFSRGYGLANLDDGISITPKTSIHLASLSKQFTAAAIALLILNHKIALSDPVAKYIPEVAKYGQGLHIEHLIYMTSGIHEYTDVPRKKRCAMDGFLLLHSRRGDRHGTGAGSA